MATQEEKYKIVERGVNAQAQINKYLAKAHKAAEDYADVIADAVENGFFASGLTAKRDLSHARTLPGKIAEAALVGAELHILGTQLATDNEVDLGSVTSVGGVDFVKRDNGGITIMSGGDR